ncbi:hypothetical protein Tco_0838038 [Tanacetum coccineum]
MHSSSILEARRLVRCSLVRWSLVRWLLARCTLVRWLLARSIFLKQLLGLGYNAATAASPAVEGFVNLTDKSGSDKAYHAVPPPLTGNFIPRKPDLTFIDEIVESENLDVTTVVTPSNVKTVGDRDISNTVESKDGCLG